MTTAATTAATEQGSYFEHIAEKAELLATKAELQATKVELQDTKAKLQDTKVKQDDSVDTKAKQQHTKLQDEFDQKNMVKLQGLQSVNELKGASRKGFEHKYCFSFDGVCRWATRKPMYEAFVAKHRLGMHGLRPCGLRGYNLFLGGRNKGQGARITAIGEDQPTKHKPLQLVYERLKLWLNNERQHGHEVSTRILTQQLIFELEYERDKQLVLQQTASNEFFEQTLEACRKKLAFLRVLSPSERQRKWLSKTVFPRIGATTRVPNRLTDKDTRFDYTKCKASAGREGGAAAHQGRAAGVGWDAFFQSRGVGFSIVEASSHIDTL